MFQEFIGSLHTAILPSADARNVLVLLPEGGLARVPDALNGSAATPLSALFPFTGVTRLLPVNDEEVLPAIRAIITDVSPTAVCLFPPAARITSPDLKEYGSGLGIVSLDALCLYQALQALPSGSRLLAFSFANILYLQSTSRLRSYMASQHTVDWIVEYDQEGIFAGVLHSLRFSSLLLTVGLSQDGLTRLFTGPANISRERAFNNR